MLEDKGGNSFAKQTIGTPSIHHFRPGIDLKSFPADIE